MKTLALLRLLPAAWGRLLVTAARYFDLRRAVRYTHLEAGLPRPFDEQRVLHVGSGAGLTLLPLAGQGAVVMGVDEKVRAIETAQCLASALRLSDAQFQVAAVESLPFRARSFDVVIADQALERAGDAMVALKEVGRVLRTGGILALTVRAAGPAHPLLRLLPRESLRPESFTRRFNPDDLRQRLELLGFEVVDVGPCFTGIGALAVEAFARVYAMDPATPGGRLLYSLLSPLLYGPSILSDALNPAGRGYELRLFAVRRSTGDGPPRSNGNGHGRSLQNTVPLEQPLRAVGSSRSPSSRGMR